MLKGDLLSQTRKYPPKAEQGRQDNRLCVIRWVGWCLAFMYFAIDMKAGESKERNCSIGPYGIIIKVLG